MLAIAIAVFKAWQLSYDIQNPWASTVDHICFDMHSLRDPTSSQASETRVQRASLFCGRKTGLCL